MKAIALFLIFVALIQFGESDEILINFIRDYYEAYNIHQIVIFACWEYAVDISRNIMDLDTIVTYQSTTDDADLKTILRVNYYHVGIVLDFDCPFSENILDKFSTQLQFNESYHWLVLSTLSPISKIYLQSLSLTVASELTSAIRADDKFKLFDIYNPSYQHGGSVKIIDKGEWTPENGLHNKLNQYKYTRRADLEQLCLNMSVALYDPPIPDLMTYLSTYMNIQMDTMTRAHYPVVAYLQDMYNFSMKVHQATTWGYLVNGSYNGLIADVISGAIDMSLTPFEFHAMRLLYIDYLVETWYLDSPFTFLHPKISTLRNNFLRPFANDLWWMILLVGAIYWALLLLSVLLEQRHKDEPENASLRAIETGLTTVAAVSQQGLSDSPNFYSGRITFLSLFFWALLLYQFYSASIVSSLMAAPPRWIKTVKDLSDSQLEVGAMNVSYYINYLQTITDLDLIELYKCKINPHPNPYLSLSQGLKKIQEGGYAYLAGTTATYPYIQNNFLEEQICALEEVRFAKPRRLSLIIFKGSPFRKMMIYGIRKIIQSGIMHRLETIWRVPRPRCPENYNDMPTPMGIPEFCPAIFLLCIGVAVSIIILIMEYLYLYVQTRFHLARISVVD